MSELRNLPSVNDLLLTAGAVDLISAYSRPLTVEAVRLTLDRVRSDFQKAKANQSSFQLPAQENILSAVKELLETWLAPTLSPVINATGVILHTNLGRAPLCASALQAIQEIASGYTTLEYDLQKGTRGSRLIHAEELLKRLSGAEAAIVVNNNAAAVLLALSALAHRKRVIISRTQLIEIGGGFRIPAVMSQSGAKLVEVGTTNRVHLRDYEEALSAPAALLLTAHHSNFRMTGFTSEPSIAELAALASRHEIPLMNDLGSGTLLNTEAYGLPHEPTIQEAISEGCDLVCFSGDKLLGGPQAGILIGRGDLLAKIKKHPLARAVRSDKLCLAALSATLRHYLKNSAEEEIPIWQMISARVETLEQRAHRWAEQLNAGSTLAGLSTIGGGSLPEETLPTCLLALNVSHPNPFLTALRSGKISIIARVENNRVVFDPRTVLPHQEESLLAGIKTALGG